MCPPPPPAPPHQSLGWRLYVGLWGCGSQGPIAPCVWGGDRAGCSCRASCLESVAAVREAGDVMIRSSSQDSEVSTVVGEHHAGTLVGGVWVPLWKKGVSSLLWRLFLVSRQLGSLGGDVSLS